MEQGKRRLKKAGPGATEKVMGERLADVNLDKKELMMFKMKPRGGATIDSSVVQGRKV